MIGIEWTCDNEYKVLSPKSDNTFFNGIVKVGNIKISRIGTQIAFT